MDGPSDRFRTGGRGRDSDPVGFGAAFRPGYLPGGFGHGDAEERKTRWATDGSSRLEVMYRAGPIGCLLASGPRHPATRSSGGGAEGSQDLWKPAPVVYRP